MANMFDFLDDPNKKNKSTSVITPTTKSGSGNMFDFLDEAPSKPQTQSTLPLERRFSQPNTAPIPSANPFKMLPSHVVPKAPQETNYGAAWARGTLGSLVGRAVTPLAEKITGREIDISKLPESNTLGEKALGLVGNLGADLPLWLAGDAALAKPLSMLAKTKPVASAVSKLLPKAIQPALGTGVRAASTYGLPINALETAMDKDGVEGFTDRLKEAPLMGLGGVALHGAGQAIGKGIKTGVDFNRFNKATKLPETKPNFLGDVQGAFKNPNTLRDAQAQQFSRTFADTPNLMSPVKLKPLQQGIDDAVGVRKPLTNEMLRQRKLDVKEALTLRPGSEVPLPQRNIPNAPRPLQWTNKQSGTVGPLPIRSITQGNLNQLPGQRLPQAPFSTRVTAPQQPQTPLVSPLGVTQAQTVPQAGMGTAETFRAKINRNPKKKSKFSEMVKDARTQFTDDVAPFEKAERAINGKLASAEDSIYKQARLYRGNPEQAAEFVRSKLSPVIKSVEKQGKTTLDMGDYALAVHARDVNAKGINSGFTNEEIAATIQKFGTPEMEAARKELMKINNELLDSLAEAGLIEKSLVTALNKKHPNYMSLSRAFDDDKVEFVSGLSKSLANVSSPLKQLKGSDKDVIDPIESMIKNIYKSISAVDRNKVALQLGPLADKDASGKIIRRLAEGEEKSRLNAVYAMENGKKVHYEVQPDVYRALLGLDKESANKFIKIFQVPAGLLRAGATLTPEFFLRNPIRDIPSAYAVSNSGLNPLRDIPMALFDVIRSRQGKQTLYNQFLKDNAGYGNLISTDRKVLQDAMTDILKESTGKKFVNIVSGKSLIRVLRSIADVSENATKLGEYRAALRSGASRPEAAYRARDLMDFARAGASVREPNKIVAFLNANVQGKSKIYRAIKEDPVGVTARAFKAITLPTIGAFIAQKYLANDKQRAIIDDAEGWLTSTFWLVPIPGTDQVARIPKPFDLAPVFANGPERAMKYIFDNDPEAFEGFAKQTMASYALPTMITGLMPMLEGMANYSMFRQGPIIPQRESGLNFQDQYDSRTTETAKFISKGVNKLTGGEGAFKNFGSPRIIDNTIKGLTAGLGTYATSAIDQIAEATGAVDKKNKPARNVSELPLLRAFLTSEKSGGKSMEKLYDEKDTLSKDKASAKLNKEKFSFTDQNRLSKLTSVTDQISDITKEIRKIEGDRNTDPQTKRDKINALTQKRNILARKVTQ